MKLILSNIPMPPSSNHQYWCKAFMVNGKPMARMAPAPILDQYVKEMEVWRLTNLVLVGKARIFCRDVLMTGKALRVDSYFCFPHSQLMTQKMLPKKMDATNRIKALHDCLASILVVDDSLFWSGYQEKIETSKEKPYVICVLKPSQMRGVRDLSSETL